jgi:hypothetical protein
MEYPKHHRAIIHDLLDGKFLLAGEDSFISLKQNEGFYIEFFKESFNYDLKVTHDYSYIVSGETNETLSRDVSIFLALLCYEIDKDGKNFMDLIQFSEFEMETIDHYFTNSSYPEVVNSNKQLKDKDSRKNFVNMMNRRNIIEKNGDDRFVFTPAYKVFMDFARELGSSRINQVQEA